MNMDDREIEVEIKLNRVQYFKFLVYKVFFQLLLNFIKWLKLPSFRSFSVFVVVTNIFKVLVSVEIIDLCSNEHAESSDHESIKLSIGEFFRV